MFRSDQLRGQLLGFIGPFENCLQPQRLFFAPDQEDHAGCVIEPPERATVKEPLAMTASPSRRTNSAAPARYKASASGTIWTSGFMGWFCCSRPGACQR